MVELMSDKYEELRDFFYEVAALDGTYYPKVNMKVFAEYCLAEGVNLLKAEIKGPEL